MASSKFPFVLRCVHSVLHVMTVLLIVIGVLTMPNSTTPLVIVGKRRGTFWIVLEILYTLVSLAAVSILVASTTRPALHSKISQKCPNINFFYYTLMTIIVLYGTMTGCNIPYLFNKTPYYSVTLPPAPTEKWQISTILAVVVSIINSVLYFVAAFYPMVCFDEEPNAETQKDDMPAAESAPTPAQRSAVNLQGEIGENAGTEGEQVNN